MKKIAKKAFTMAEVLMVLAVLGVIAAILIPSIASMKPDQNRVMFKKAYYQTERIIAEIVNDEELYTSDGSNIGFPQMHAVQTLNAAGNMINRTFENPRPSNAGGAADMLTAGDSSDTSAAAGRKLCLLFADRLNIVKDFDGTTGCNVATNALGNTGNAPNPSFKTVDGVWWYFPTQTGIGATGGQWAYTASVTPTRTNGGIKVVRIDTNGDKRPNCRCTAANCNGCRKPDRFEIEIRYDGKMSVPAGLKEADYLRAASAVSDK